MRLVNTHYLRSPFYPLKSLVAKYVLGYVVTYVCLKTNHKEEIKWAELHHFAPRDRPALHGKVIKRAG